MKYGESVNFYNAGSSALARRVAEKTGCPIMERETEKSRWWPILYIGRNAGKDEDGSYVWKLRDELAQALDRVDLSQVELYAASASGEEEHRYWWLNANPKISSLIHCTTIMATNAVYSKISWMQKQEIWLLVMNRIR